MLIRLFIWWNLSCPIYHWSNLFKHRFQGLLSRISSDLPIICSSWIRCLLTTVGASQNWIRIIGSLLSLRSSIVPMNLLVWTTINSCRIAYPWTSHVTTVNTPEGNFHNDWHHLSTTQTSSCKISENLSLVPSSPLNLKVFLNRPSWYYSSSFDLICWN
jgi:hypothetical protein